MASPNIVGDRVSGREPDPEQTFGEQVNDAVDAVKEFLPLPAGTQPVTEPYNHDVANSMAEEPTLSHALAVDDHEEKGRAQLDHEEEDVVDLGWNEKKERIAAPLVGGLNNEDLWLLIRRFNKVRLKKRRMRAVATLRPEPQASPVPRAHMKKQTLM